MWEWTVKATLTMEEVGEEDGNGGGGRKKVKTTPHLVSRIPCFWKNFQNQN